MFLKDEFKPFPDFSLFESAKLLALQELVNGLIYYKQFSNIDGAPDNITFSLDDLSQLNTHLLSPRIRVSLNHEMPDILYIHVAGSPKVRKTAFDRLDQIQNDLEAVVNHDFETPYFRILIIDEGADHSIDQRYKSLSSRGLSQRSISPPP